MARTNETNDKKALLAIAEKMDDGAKQAAKDAASAFLKTRQASVTVPTLTLDLIPMNNGRYGYTLADACNVMIDGKEKQVSVVVMHPASEPGNTQLHIGLQLLADERSANRAALNTVESVSKAAAKLGESAQDEVLRTILIAKGIDESKVDTVLAAFK